MEGKEIPKNIVEVEKEPKGIGFVFSHSVEKDNPAELNEESKERLDKAVELYNENKLAYILVAGGEFIKGLEKPVAKMMTDYLTSKGIPQDAIIEERHSKDTTSNIRFGKFLLNYKKLESLPVYYISSGYHLKRIETIVTGQEKDKKNDKFVSSGKDTLDQVSLTRIAEFFNGLVNKYDPEGQSVLAKIMRKKRTHPIKH
jgi:hypothetical protein